MSNIFLTFQVEDGEKNNQTIIMKFQKRLAYEKKVACEYIMKLGAKNLSLIKRMMDYFGSDHMIFNYGFEYSLFQNYHIL